MYRKGANAERELMHYLYEKGFSVIRSAGSGKMRLPTPDIVALRGKRKLAIEVKNWNKKYLSISAEQMAELIDFSEKGKTELFVAWKVPKKGFYIFHAQDMRETDKNNYAITLKEAKHCAIPLDVIAGEQSTLYKKS